MAISVVLFAAFSVLAAVYSQDFLEADACVHYLYARYALDEPVLLVDVWGRPFCTLINAIPARVGGRLGVQLTSLLIALASGLATLRIAAGQGYRRPALALIFFLAQPLVFLHSFSELTELPFVLLLTLSFWAYQKQCWLGLALAAGMLPTARPEGFGFLALAAGALLLHGKKRWLPILILPLLGWSVAGWLLCGQPQPWALRIITWLYDNWPYSAASAYGRGPIYHFLVLLPAVVSPIVFPAMLAGVGWSLAGRGWPGCFRNADHVMRCQWLIAAIPVLLLAGHSLLYWSGRMASSGEPRYLLTAAPFWALLAARGWEWTFEQCRWTGAMPWAGVAAAFPVLVNVVWRVVPLRAGQEARRAQEVARWYSSGDLRQQYPRLAAGHPAVYYYAGLNIRDRRQTAEWHYRTIADPPPGVLLVWDDVYGRLNADSQRTMELRDLLTHRWVPVKVFEAQKTQADGPVKRWAQTIQTDQVGPWYVFLSPQDIAGRPTPLPTTLPAELQRRSPPSTGPLP